MSKRASRKLRNRLEGMFAAVPEADPFPDSNGGRAGAGPMPGVPGGWLWETDLEGRYTWCSPEIERFLGWSPSNLIGKDLTGVALTSDSVDKVRPALSSRRAVDGLRLEAKGADGSYVTLLLSAQLRPGLDGKPAGYRGAVQVLSVTPGAAPEPAQVTESPAATVEPRPEPEAAPEAAPEPVIREATEHGQGAPPVSEGEPIEETPVLAEGETVSPQPLPEPPAQPRPRPARSTGPLQKRQTGSLRKRQTGQLAVTAAQSPEDVRPMEPPPLMAAWGPATAYVDTARGLQPMASGPAQLVTEPRIEGGRLLVPIRVKDEVLGVLAFDEHEAQRPWNEDDIAMAMAISEQLAVTLQDARSAELTETALEEMREADRLKTQFLANMSHELRTPLNSIIGFSRVILKGIDGPVNETQETDLEAIHNAGLHLLGLINDMLDLSKIEAGKMELTFGDVDLKEIVRGVMSTASGLVKDKPIELLTRLPDDLPILQADSIRVRQILLNLVSNAAKFTDDGQIELEVSLADDIEPPEVVVSVADTGPGIAPEDQAKLFEPFSQVDASPTRKTGGTGLGLSICRYLVELHGGTIWVESRPGQGSTFYFTIPVRQPETGEAQPEGIIQAEAEPQPQGPLVLAVDDDPAVLASYESTFRAQGYRFTSAAGPEGALELARSSHPDLIVIDPMLSDHGGWDLATQLRSLASMRNTPILLGSINAQNATGYRIHAADLRVRPADPQELLPAIHRLAAGNGRPLQVLLIEDDEDEAAEMGKTIRSDDTLSLRLASNSTEAYHATREDTPDIVVLSLMMARAEGFRALEIVRKDPRLRDTPVMVLVASQPHAEERRQMTLYTEYLHRQGTGSQDAYLTEMDSLVQSLLSRR